MVRMARILVRVMHTKGRVARQALVRPMWPRLCGGHLMKKTMRKMLMAGRGHRGTHSRCVFNLGLLLVGLHAAG